MLYSSFSSGVGLGFEGDWKTSGRLAGLGDVGSGEFVLGDVFLLKAELKDW